MPDSTSTRTGRSISYRPFGRTRRNWHGGRPAIARDVACPTCKVQPGEGCITTRGHVHPVGVPIHGAHPARVRVSTAKARREAPPYDPPRLTLIGNLVEILDHCCPGGD